MSNRQTNWILNLIDRITGPMRTATEATQGMEEAVEQVQAAVNLSARDTRIALQNETQNRRDLMARIREQEKALRDLQNEQSNTAPGEQWQRIQNDINAVTRRVQNYRDALQASEQDIRDLTDANQRFLDRQRGWDNAITGINQFTELAEKAQQSLEFGNEIKGLTANIARMTGESGAELDSLTAKAVRLASVYGEDAQEIARSANAVSKQMGISFDEAFSLIDQGFQKGANLNGDMLDQLKEYGPQMRAAGISAAEAIAIMTKAGQDGVFSDKALDAIKEAGLSLREMGQPQIDALKGIGIEVKDLAGKTSFEAAQMISKSMQKATVQARQLALTDIFKGAGEDAGMGFIMGLADVNMDISSIPSIQQAGEGMNSFLADLKTSVATTFGEAIMYVQNFGMVATSLASVITIVQSLASVTWIQSAATKAITAAQWLWNAALTANPIGIVIVAIGALVGGIVYAWNKFEGFRAVLFGLWEVFKTVFNNIAGLFKVVFGPVAEAFEAITNGDWKKAAGAVFKLNPVSMAMSAGKYISEGGLTKGVTDAYKRGDAMGRQSFRDSKKEGAENEKPKTSIDGVNGGPTKLDGKIAPDKKGKGKSGDGLNIDGSGGSKTITMNLYLTNNFKVSEGMDIRQIADKIMGHVNDRLKDAALSL